MSGSKSHVSAQHSSLCQCEVGESSHWNWQPSCVTTSVSFAAGGKAVAEHSLEVTQRDAVCPVSTTSAHL